MEGKYYWPNRFVFILAAIGSAAGLGNLWRFPFLAYDHGGGAFVLAIIIANIVVGIPLLLLEVGLGQMMQRGAVDAFGKIKGAFRYLGWTALTFGFLVLMYYMAVVAWGIDYFASAFTLSWGTDTKSFFFEDILALSPGVGTVGGISWPVFAGLLLGWALVYFCVWKGVRSISKVVVWTATLPFVILAILIVRAVTLEGSGAGLALFFLPDWGALLSAELWLAAFSQVFFSLSLAFGVMIAYGSLKPLSDEITKSVVWVAAGNFLVSLMSGIVVFGTLGFMAHEQGTAISDVVVGGPSLVFIVFPEIINMLPALNAFIAILFFCMFISLALDSAFSLLEAVVVSIRDRYPLASTKKIALVLSLIGILGGTLYATSAGLYFLDIADHFIVNYGLVAIGMFEALVVGWLWKSGELRDFINEYSRWRVGTLWSFAIRWVIPLFLLALLVSNLLNEFKAPYGGYSLWALVAIGALPVLLTPVIALLLDALTGGRRETTKQPLA